MITIMRPANTIIRSSFGLMCGIIAAFALPAIASVRTPTALKQMIADPRTGLAMFGYDPVAYHSEGRAMQGKAQFSAVIAGLHWRFVSAANRAVFEADPEGYLPLFGGHDGFRIAENRLVTGDPTIYLMANGQPVFFRTPEDRDTFARDENLRRKAQQLWPEVATQFAGH